MGHPKAKQQHSACADVHSIVQQVLALHRIACYGFPPKIDRWMAMREYHVLNLGAGVQSTTLYLLAREGRIAIDLAIFADTQEEPQAVYRHLHWLQSLKDPPIWIRSAGKLGSDLLQGRNSTGGRFVSIPAFTRGSDNRVGILQRQCTKEYKIETVDRAIRRELLQLKPRQRIPKEVHIYQYFGISTDEAGRAHRAKRRFEGIRHMTPVYPLIDMGWSRTDCLNWLKERVPHPVPRSSCVFCPYHTQAEWAWLRRNDQDGWNRAVNVDRALRSEHAVCRRGLQNPLYLHRSCRPLEEVEFPVEPQETVHPMTTQECLGMCGI